MKKILYLLQLSILLIFACKEDSYVTLPPDLDIGTFYQDTLYAVDNTYLISGKINTGNANKLLLGSYRGFESRILLLFKNKHFITDTLEVDSVQLILKSLSSYGESSAPISGTIYLLEEDWSDSINAYADENFIPVHNTSPLTSVDFELSLTDSIVYAIDLPSTFVSLLRDTINYFGLLVDFNEADQIKIFKGYQYISKTAPLQGALLTFKVGNAENNTAIRDSIEVTSDATLIDFNDVEGIYSDDRLFVSSGYAAHTFLKFDISNIPKKAIISRANIRLKKDENSSITNPNKNQRIYIRNILSDFNLIKSAQPEYEIDNLFATPSSQNSSMYLIEKEDGYFEFENKMQSGNAVNVFQYILNGERDHEGFYLEYDHEDSYVSVCAFRNREDPDINNRPVLIINYFVPDGPFF